MFFAHDLFVQSIYHDVLLDLKRFELLAYPMATLLETALSV